MPEANAWTTHTLRHVVTSGSHRDAAPKENPARFCEGSQMARRRKPDRALVPTASVTLREAEIQADPPPALARSLYCTCNALRGRCSPCRVRRGPSSDSLHRKRECGHKQTHDSSSVTQHHTAGGVWRTNCGIPLGGSEQRVPTAGGNATYQILGGRGGQVQAGAFYAESIFTARSDLHVYSR